MNRLTRLSLFFFYLILIGIAYYSWKSVPLPRTDIKVIIISSLILLSFVTLFIEHYFTKPTDVIASTLSILLLLSPLRGELIRFGVWFDIFYLYNLVLLVTALSTLLILDESGSSSSLRNRTSICLKTISVHFGNGKILYFALFALTLIFYVDSQSYWFLVLFFYSAIILFIDPKKIAFSLFIKKSGKSNDIGHIFGVQSRNTFLVKLFDRRIPVKRFDFVEFKYSIDKTGKVYRGLIIDNYLLNKEQWIKVLVTPEIREAFEDIEYNKIEKSDVVHKIEADSQPDFLSRFVGVVMEGSSIGKIRFEYGGKASVSEGTLVELFVNKKRIFYQVVQGTTTVEWLEQKNEAGLVVGEAIQLGEWIPKRTYFEKFGWVPEMNSPVYIAGTVPEVQCGMGELIIGNLPNTNCPIIMNKKDAVSHHMAILGVTGAGKSVFSRNLLRELVQDGKKIICVDFTNEYKSKMSDLGANSIVSTSSAERIFYNIDKLAIELAKYANQQNANSIQKYETEIVKEIQSSIQVFLQSEDSHFTIFELPDVSNTTGTLEYTKKFFQVLFMIAKNHNNFDKEVCVVLEEAHTVIPEWNFVGTSDRTSQSLVNSIGQIALQGRKYNIGFIVIAQRTANVSKTVLTQCNSIIAFQQFDKTSADFLTNYMGSDMVAALPTLRFRQAVAVGKAFKANMPVIFEVPEIIESC